MKTFSVLVAAVAASETTTVETTTPQPVSSANSTTTASNAGWDQCKAEFSGAKSFRGSEKLAVRPRPWEMKTCPLDKKWQDFVEKESLPMYDTSSAKTREAALKKLKTVCEKPEFVTKETGSYPLSMIAKAYHAAGLKKENCKDALIIAGGECQNDTNKKGHCFSSGPSGVFQCDACASALTRSPDFKLFENLDNVCYNVWAQFVVQVVPEMGGLFGFDPQNQKYNPRCLQMKGNWDEKDMFQEVNEFNDNACSCNAMGPFCHKTFLGGKQQTKAAGNAWAGGAHLAHPQPHFQSYYRGRFLINLGLYEDGPTWYDFAPAGFNTLLGKKWLETHNQHGKQALPVLTDEAEQYLYEQSDIEAQKICDAAV